MSKEKVNITYDQRKLVIHGQSFSLIIDASMPTLLSIYSSGSGTSLAELVTKTKSLDQAVPIKEVVKVKPEVKLEVKEVPVIVEMKDDKEVVANVVNTESKVESKSPIIQIEEEGEIVIPTSNTIPIQELPSIPTELKDIVTETPVGVEKEVHKEVQEPEEVGIVPVKEFKEKVVEKSKKSKSLDDVKRENP